MGFDSSFRVRTLYQKCIVVALESFQLSFSPPLRYRSREHGLCFQHRECRSPDMSKQTAIAKATGVAPNAGGPEQSLLSCRAVVDLAQHISAAIVASSTVRKPRVSRTGCSQLALQILAVAAGLRRAALVDALGLTAAQASAIGLRLGSLSKQNAQCEDLQWVRLLYHAPTSQTFVLSTKESLWADVEALVGRSASLQPYTAVWVDARFASEHAAPTVTVPDSHIISLVSAIHKVALSDDSQDLLIVTGPPIEPRKSSSGDAAEAQLVGVALAGFLLEYGTIYCIHTPTACDVGTSHPYDVRPFKASQGEIAEADFPSSAINCLGSQPLIVFKVLWSDQTSTLELVSFSIPQRLCSEDDADRLRQTLASTFRARLNSLDPTTIFASGRICVDVSAVTLHHVAL